MFKYIAVDKQQSIVYHVSHDLHSYILYVVLVFVDKTSSIPPLFIELPVPNQESERSSICLLGYRFCLFLLCFFFSFCFHFNFYIYYVIYEIK
jgi:hypothetical protein